MATKKTVKEKPLYTASIKVLGKTFTANGSTISEAVGNLDVGNAKGMSILTILKGDESRSKILPATQTFRLFSPSKLMREIALKNVSMLFDL